MCKKINAEQITTGKLGASEINCMAIGTDCLKINNKYGIIEVGEETGLSASIDCGNKTLYFSNGILVRIEEKD